MTDWKPDSLAGFRTGDTVTVPTLGKCLVVALIPPSLLQVTTESGGTAKVGWKAAEKSGTRPRLPGSNAEQGAK